MLQRLASKPLRGLRPLAFSHLSCYTSSREIPPPCYPSIPPSLFPIESLTSCSLSQLLSCLNCPIVPSVPNIRVKSVTTSQMSQTLAQNPFLLPAPAGEPLFFAGYKRMQNADTHPQVITNLTLSKPRCYAANGSLPTLW